MQRPLGLSRWTGNRKNQLTYYTPQAIYIHVERIAKCGFITEEVVEGMGLKGLTLWLSV